MKLNYKHTMAACCASYVTQAVVVNFSPLLFVQFGKQFGISLSQISVLISVCFGVELVVDLIAAKYSSRFSQRATVIAALVISAMGFGGLALFPFIFKDPFVGLIISNALCGIGGGFMEVMISPILEACPTRNKTGNMSILHSFFCWGQALVILATTLFFAAFGVENWRVMALIWTSVPAVGIIMFSFVPIYNDPSKLPARERAKSKSAPSLFSVAKSPLFAVFFIIMIAAGAAELVMSQWASSFAESGLNVSKAEGDILGPCLFGILMGVARVVYSFVSKRVNALVCMTASAVLCAVSYLIAALSPVPLVSLLGCGLCGLAVGIFWPGALSLAAESINGSVTLFALLAVGGDLGCLIGPALAGRVADLYGGDLSVSFLFTIIFPTVIALSVALLPALTRRLARSKKLKTD